MRRVRKEHRLLPYAAGVITGYIVTLMLSAVAALLLFLTDSAEGLSGAAAVIISALSCFCGGRRAGRLRRHDGLRTGFICGIIYMLPFALVALIWGTFGGALFWVKLILCAVFGAAGGVNGVNSPEKR